MPACLRRARTDLARLADAIGEKTGMSASSVGVLVLAAVTSLPELATGISALTTTDAATLPWAMSWFVHRDWRCQTQSRRRCWGPPRESQGGLVRRARRRHVVAQCSCALSPRGRCKVTKAGVGFVYQK